MNQTKGSLASPLVRPWEAERASPSFSSAQTGPEFLAELARPRTLRLQS